VENSYTRAVAADQCWRAPVQVTSRSCISYPGNARSAGTVDPAGDGDLDDREGHDDPGGPGFDPRRTRAGTGKGQVTTCS